MKQLNSYLPESLRFHQKTEEGARIFSQDLAVVDGATRTVLAHRGEAFEAEGIGCAVLSDAALWEWVTAPRAGASRLLLGAGEGSLLVLADLFRLSGLLVLAYLPAPSAAVALALARMGRRDVALLEGILPRTSSAAEEEALPEDLRELLYYLDRVLCAKEAVSLWTSCVTVAALAGCRLEQVAMPPTLPDLKPSDVARLHLFLLCTLLTLRGKEGRVLASSQENAECSLCQCRVELLTGAPPRGRLLDGEEISSQEGEGEPLDVGFLSVPCFSDFAMRQEEGGRALCADLPIGGDADTLCAHSRPLLLRLILTPQSA